MSDLTEAAAELMGAYQEVSESTPQLTFGGETVDVLPDLIGNDPMMVPGGTAEGAQFSVSTLASDWGTAPEDLDVVSLSGHPTAPDTDYQVLSRRFYESWLVFTLGNADAS